MYRLTLVAYCGITTVDGEFSSWVEGRDAAEAYIERHEARGGYVHHLVNNDQELAIWELETPEDAAGVSDYDGILKLRYEESEEEYREGDR